MPDLTVPTSPIQSAGRAAEVRVEASNLGGYVAEFGQKLEQVGDTIQASEDRHELARAKVDITRDLGELNLKYKNEADPAAIDRGWAADMEELRGRYKERTSARNWGEVNLALEDLGNRYALSLGQRAIDLRTDRSLATLYEYTQETYKAAAEADDETRAELLGNLEDALADAVADNRMSAEDAARIAITTGADTERAVARRMLDEDPQGLLDKLDADGFPGLDPQVRETVRAGATSAIATAQAAEARERERLEKERAAAIGDDLDVVIAAARNGQRAAAEIDLMNDPQARQHPDFQEARDAIDLRNDLPGFNALPPAEMDAAIEAERGRPLRAKHETRRLDAMIAARDQSAAAWEKDPYAQAQEVFGNPPPSLPQFAAGQPDEFAQALKSRRAYAVSLNEAGYTDDVEYFSTAEKEELKKLAAVENDPADRLALASTLTRALGKDAGAAISQIGGDPLFEHAGGMIAAGGDPDTGRKILEGQQALANKTVSLPKADAKLDVLFAEFGTLFAGNDAAEARLREAADAIYATEARGLDPTAEGSGDKAFKTYARALHLAAGGGYDKNGNPVGGIGVVQGAATILPVGVSAATVEAAFDLQERAIVGKRFVRMDGERPVIEDVGKDGGVRTWTEASRSGGVPLYGGEPIEWKDMADLKLRAVGDDLYQLYVEPRPGYAYDITDSENPGQPYRFSLRAFLAEVRK